MAAEARRHFGKFIIVFSLVANKNFDRERLCSDFWPVVLHITCRLRGRGAFFVLRGHKKRDNPRWFTLAQLGAFARQELTYNVIQLFYYIILLL